MNPSQMFFTVFELILITSVILGIIFEYKLIDFEIALKEKIKNLLEVIFLK